MKSECVTFVLLALLASILAPAHADKSVSSAPTPSPNTLSPSGCAESTAVFEQVKTIVCLGLNGQVTQVSADGSSTSLGAYAGKQDNVVSYKNGDPCRSQPGQKMSASVSLSCGAQLSVDSVVVGGGGCQFSISMSAPSVCDGNVEASPSPSPSPKVKSPSPIATSSPPTVQSPPTLQSPPEPSMLSPPVPDVLPAVKSPQPHKHKAPSVRDFSTSPPEPSAPNEESTGTKHHSDGGSTRETSSGNKHSTVDTPSVNETNQTTLNSQDSTSIASKGAEVRDAVGQKDGHGKGKDDKDKLTKDNAVLAAVIIGPMFVVTTALCWGSLFAWRKYKEREQQDPSLTDPFSTVDNPLSSRHSTISAASPPPMPSAASTPGGGSWV